MAGKTAYEILSLGKKANAELHLDRGGLVIVTGPNGVGKSSFIENLRNPDSVSVERFFGGREIHFSSNDTDHVGQKVPELLSQFSGNVKRYRNPWGQQHLKSVIRRILDSQAQTAQEILELVRRGETLADAEVKFPQPISQINSVFDAARLPVRLAMENGGLLAKQSGATYGIDRLSDGERAALLLVGAIVIQPSGGFVLIDEPERHLNPAISGALIAAAVRARTDVGFVLSTHDLTLIDWLRPDNIIHIRGSTIVSELNEERKFTYSVLGSGDGIPEELRYAILGSRRAVLLVEGTATSEDRSLYAHVYPNWNIVPREGWDSVVGGVSALTQNAAYHWLTIAGLIDGDGRATDEIEALAKKGVFALSVPTIENIFVHNAVVAEMADAAGKLHGGLTGEQRMLEIERKLKPLIEEHKGDLISRRVAWAANRALVAMKISVDDARNGLSSIPSIDVDAIRNVVTAEFNKAVEEGSIFDVVQRLPIKNTKIPSAIADIAGFGNFKKYARAVLAQIETGSEIGQRVLSVIRDALPALPSLVNTGEPLLIAEAEPVSEVVRDLPSS